MMICPNCNHSNPIGAVQCESCFTPLPALSHCPNCGSSITADASFCGQCGFNLKASPAGTPAIAAPETAKLPGLLTPDPLVAPDPLIVPVPPPPVPEAASPIAPPPPMPVSSEPPPPLRPNVMPPVAPLGGSTQLQSQTAKLLHLQTNIVIEMPPGLPVIHIGKPNDRIPPDIDVSGFPDAEIVSRVHADLRVEGDAYFIEDVGSSNGTYVNNAPLPVGSRYRLRSGDRIAFGKGDKVSFLFQITPD